MELLGGTMPGTQRPKPISTKLQQIAKLARDRPGEALTAVAHHIDIEWLREAFRRTRKDGAPGVDGVVAHDYEEDLDKNLSRLLDRAKSGTYRAPPVRRVEIPKGSGTETRPIGIPTFEDKVLQRAVTMALEAIYEQEFVDESFGFRPGRSAHQALDRLRECLIKVRGGFVLELDIRRFFDTLDRGILRKFLHQRIRDGVLLRLVGKWLQAGVIHNGVRSRPSRGTPQGGVVSPLLANVYLHHVLDLWFEQDVKPCLVGKAHLVRYADDATLVFESESDARRVLEVLPKRFARFGLALHPDKTRLIDFRRPVRGLQRVAEEAPLERTFVLLGFLHYWGKSREGYPVIKRKTSKDRFRKTVRAASDWCRIHRHWPVAEQHRALCRKLRGHDAYFGITGNFPALHRLRQEVRRVWRKWLSRRSQRGNINWESFNALLARYPLPPPRVVHSIYRS